MDFLESQKIAYPDLSNEYGDFASLYQRKLWHQLSVALEAFLSRKETLRGNNYIDLYKSFIVLFESKLSQVKLALIASKIGHCFSDNQQALEFFQNVLSARTRLGPEASICLDMDIAVVMLKLKDFIGAKDLLDSTKETLNTIKSGETVVFSKYYEALSEYYKINGPPTEFYKAGLMFLAYTSTDDLSSSRKFELATDMALAALSGENIYNFGEVIATPILESLKGTPNEWLQDLILAVNSGNIDKFNVTVNKYSQQYYSQPALASQHEVIKQKLVLLCLLNIVFERSSNDRIITFVDISARTRIPVDQVEWVIMKAISLGLIRGTMDEVDQVVDVEWIQPRVLENSQLEVLKNQISDWSEKVKQALIVVEDQAAELFV